VEPLAGNAEGLGGPRLITIVFAEASTQEYTLDAVHHVFEGALGNLGTVDDARVSEQSRGEVLDQNQVTARTLD